MNAIETAKIQEVWDVRRQQIQKAYDELDLPAIERKVNNVDVAKLEAELVQCGKILNIEVRCIGTDLIVGRATGNINLCSEDEFGIDRAFKSPNELLGEIIAIDPLRKELVLHIYRVPRAMGSADIIVYFY